VNKFFLIIFLAAVLVLSACAAEESTAPAETAYQKIDFAGEKATSDERSACEAVGGTVRRAGLRGWEHCIQDMPDAGKTCSDSSECVARCTIPIQEGREYSPGEPATGACAQTDEVFGCFTRVSGGKAEPTLCVD